MIIETFITGPFQQNTRIVACETTKKAICIDPGDDSPEIAEFINENALDLQAIAITHGHLDHIGGVSDLHRKFPDAEIIMHKDDEDFYYGLPEQPLAMGVPPAQLKAMSLEYEVPPRLTRNWRDGEIYAVGDLNFVIRHTPGHSRGHVIFAEESEKVIFGGDCLFAGSIGRTDLPGGDYDTLIRSIIEVLLPFGDDFTVYSGHGDDTTIKQEKLTNPFLNGVS